MTLPLALRALLAQGEHSVRQHSDGTLDPEIVLAIGAHFGRLSGFSAGINSHQRRHLLLLLLTVQHIIPVLTPHHMGRYALTEMVYDLTSVILYPHQQTLWEMIVERLEQWSQTQIGEQHPQLYGIMCFSTASKAIECCFTATEAYGYTAETHSSVATYFAAETYVVCGAKNEQSSQRRRQFWLFWLKAIVPRAWYDIGSGSDRAS